MDLLKEKLLYLAQEQCPDECDVLGADAVEELIDECLDGWTEEDVKAAYKDMGGGFCFDLVTTITLVFAAIGAFKTVLEVIDWYEKRAEDKKTLYDAALKALLDNGVDIRVAEEYCKRYYAL
ncbi:MAG: hypothetical protein IJQ81_05540 [Oscillibacter sp.]|nr:hypothetical protein [Oscillibacter sp.]